jgi:hypothetical protein
MRAPLALAMLGPLDAARKTRGESCNAVRIGATVSEPPPGVVPLEGSMAVALRGGPVPAGLLAVTDSVYVAPFVRPLSTALRAAEPVLVAAPPGEAVTV